MFVCLALLRFRTIYNFLGEGGWTITLELELFICCVLGLCDDAYYDALLLGIMFTMACYTPYKSVA
jgi:hypothetical protein